MSVIAYIDTLGLGGDELVTLLVLSVIGTLKIVVR